MKSFGLAALGLTLVLSGMVSCTSILGIQDRKLRAEAGGGSSGDRDGGSGGACTANCSGPGGSSSGAGGTIGIGGGCNGPCPGSGGSGGAPAALCESFYASSQCTSCLCDSCDQTGECASSTAHCDDLERCFAQSQCQSPKSCRSAPACADVLVTAPAASDTLITNLAVCAAKSCPSCSPVATAPDPRDQCAAVNGPAECFPCICSLCDATLGATCSQGTTCGAYVSCILQSGCEEAGTCAEKCSPDGTDNPTLDALAQCLGTSCKQCAQSFQGGGGATGAGGAGGIGGSGGGGVGPGGELCNFVDDNGNGEVDEGFTWTVGAWTHVAPLTSGAARQLRALEGTTPGQVILTWIDGAGTAPEAAWVDVISDDGGSISVGSPSTILKTTLGTVTGVAVASNTAQLAAFATSSEQSGTSSYAAKMAIIGGATLGVAPMTEAAPGSVIAIGWDGTEWAALFSDGASALLRSFDSSGQPSTNLTYDFPEPLDGRGAFATVAGTSVFVAEESSYGVLGFSFATGQTPQPTMLSFPTSGGLAGDSIRGGRECSNLGRGDVGKRQERGERAGPIHRPGVDV